MTLPALEFQALRCRLEQYIIVVLSYSVGNVLGQPWETKKRLKTEILVIHSESHERHLLNKEMELQEATEK